MRRDDWKEKRPEMHCDRIANHYQEKKILSKEEKRMKS